MSEAAWGLEVSPDTVRRRSRPASLFAAAAISAGVGARLAGATRRAVRLAPRRAGMLHWIFRIAVAAEFIGHGAFGLMFKAAWLPYFAVVGIPDWLGWRLMPAIGVVDISLGVLALFRPIRAVLLYMACWGFWTASLRPLAGEPVWEFLERAGNFGVPLAFLYASGWGGSPRSWCSAVGDPVLTTGRAVRLAWILRVTTAALLIGHGGFGAFMHEDAWVGYFGAVGVAPQTVEAASLVTRLGWFEIAFGLLVLVWPAPGVLLFAFAWKVGTELLRPLAGEPVWEFIERGGSYAAPLALLSLWPWRRSGVTWLVPRGHAGALAQPGVPFDEADFRRAYGRCNLPVAGVPRLPLHPSGGHPKATPSRTVLGRHHALWVGGVALAFGFLALRAVLGPASPELRSTDVPAQPGQAPQADTPAAQLDPGGSWVVTPAPLAPTSPATPTVLLPTVHQPPPAPPPAPAWTATSAVALDRGSAGAMAADARDPPPAPTDNAALFSSLSHAAVAPDRPAVPPVPVSDTDQDRAFPTTPTFVPGAILLADSFDDPAAGSLATSSPQPTHYALAYADGEYALQQLDPERGRRPAVWLPHAHADTTLSIDARLEGETPGRYVAVSCRQQLTTDSHYRLVVLPDTQQFVLERWDDDKAVPLVPWQTSRAIRGGHQSNRLEFSCVGPTIAASINGTRLASVQDGTYREGWAWLGTGSSPGSGVTAGARFDNLVLLQH